MNELSTTPSIPHLFQSRQVLDDIISKKKSDQYYQCLRTPYNMAWAKETAIPLNQRFKLRNRNLSHTCSIDFQGDVVRVRCFQTASIPWSGGERCAITEFSEKARKHMLEKVSRLDWSSKRATFITLTYHEIEPSAKVCKTHLRALLKRLYRRYGDMAVLWRLELQKRGAWHFHLIIWGLPYIEKKELLKFWREITGQKTITQIDIKLIDNARKARAYISKYLGKAQVEAILDYMTNQAVGRFWGFENRKNLVWSIRSCYSVRLRTGYYEFKTAARGHWGKVGFGAKVGFTLFVDDVKSWEQLLLALVSTWDIYDWAYGVRDGLL